MNKLKFGDIQFLPQRSRSKPWLARLKLSSGKYKVRGFASEAEASKWLDGHAVEAHMAGQERKVSAPPKGGLRFRDFAPLWMEAHLSNPAMSLNVRFADYPRMVNEILVPRLGNCFLHELTVDRIVEFVSELRGVVTRRGTSPSDKTIKNVLAVLSGILKLALRKKEVDFDPIPQARAILFGGRRSQFRLEAQRKTRDKFLSRDEIAILLREAQIYGGPSANRSHSTTWPKGDLYPPLVVMLNSGTRLGELCALVWGDLRFYDDVGYELSQPVLRISKTLLKLKDERGRHRLQDHTKGREERDIPLNPTCLGVLRAWRGEAEQRGYGLGPDAPMFPVAVEYSRFASAVRRLGERVKLPTHKQGPHTWRHAAATHMLSAGVPVPAVSRILGHKDIQTTTGVYAHVRGMDVAGATDCLGTITEAGVAPHPGGPSPFGERQGEPKTRMGQHLTLVSSRRSGGGR